MKPEYIFIHLFNQMYAAAYLAQGDSGKCTIKSVKATYYRTN